jgi:hypothetical protein
LLRSEDHSDISCYGRNRPATETFFDKHFGSTGKSKLRRGHKLDQLAQVILSFEIVDVGLSDWCGLKLLCFSQPQQLGD